MPVHKITLTDLVPLWLLAKSGPSTTARVVALMQCACIQHHKSNPLYNHTTSFPCPLPSKPWQNGLFPVSVFFYFKNIPCPWGKFIQLLCRWRAYSSALKPHVSLYGYILGFAFGLLKARKSHQLVGFILLLHTKVKASSLFWYKWSSAQLLGSTVAEEQSTVFYSPVSTHRWCSPSTLLSTCCCCSAAELLQL